MKKHIPNILTLSNLFMGCIGLVYAFKGNLAYGSYAIWLAAVFDFLDGFTARLLKVSSPIGKELDSLADMVTFGVLPSVILFKLAENAPLEILPYITFSLAIFSALRLAKFNVDTEQENSFIGMPTPAAAFFVSGLPFWQVIHPAWLGWQTVLLISISLALLLVAPIKMLALKFNDYSLGSNWARYLVVILSVLLMVFVGVRSLPIIITLYFFLSVISTKFNR